MTRKLKYVFLNIAFLPLLIILKIIGIDAASWLGGKIGLFLGGLYKGKRIARENLAHAFPDMSPAARDKILRHVMENIGRNLGETLHLPAIHRQGKRRITVKGLQHAQAAFTEKKGVIFVSGHFSNWHVVMMAIKQEFGTCAAIYRRANNRALADYLDTLYRHFTDYALPKGDRRIAVDILKFLQNNVPVLILADQHESKGVEVEFFAKPVLAPQGAAVFSRRTGAAIIPIVTYRHKHNAYFTVEFLPPLPAPQNSAKEESEQEIIQSFYTVMEQKIREQPHEWLWTHNRWKKR